MTAGAGCNNFFLTLRYLYIPYATQNCRASAYQALVALLQCTDHVSLQLAALKALRMLIDDWGFFEDHFQPFIGPTLEAALNMLP